ncbi:MAG: protein jag [Lachnospiraceae bacterium]|nr:protein jag [Lachnospiraceae bacterium]MBQ1641332.1 protein jag [Lachnospiraceae bacterium]MBQ2317482.1 protein jag [Lachnospiraceae bacterium]MBQ2578270.1 protein jag [Lachnospiraceae bacterium]MBQ4373225.1 protein jag [Lachnospiraceae bacterium]
MDFLEYSGKTVEDALTQASVQLGVTSDQIEYEVIDKGSAGILGFGSKDATIRVKKKEEATDAKDVAEAFLKDVFATMNLEVIIDSSYDDIDKVLNIDLKGPEMGIIIGKRGQTLDSLQYLVNLAVNRKSGDYVRVKIDTEDYRRRRKETLENLAKNVAYRVKRTKKPVSLEAMNPYERRIIHFALQNDSYVSTHSEGEEPYRHVVVTLKR